MNKKESIWIFVFLISGGINLILWLFTHNMIFNTMGIVLVALGLGLYLGLKSL